MIKLLVEDYCHECDMMEPTAKRYRLPCVDEEGVADVDIGCRWSERCARMYGHIKRKVEDSV